MTHPASSPRIDPPVTAESVAAVDHAITSRRSMRRFLPTEVPRDVIEDILRVAARAPSGTNAQPWEVHVLTGASRQGLVDKVLSAAAGTDTSQRYTEQYDYYPKEWIAPFIDRRRKVGWDLYGLLGIEKSNRMGMQMQQARNFMYFDAPVGLVFTMHPIMGRGSLLDYGMFLQNIMVAARARGLDTCPQAAWNSFHSVILGHLGLDPTQHMMVASMALGHADPGAIENTLLTERESVSTFTRFYG
ncbi:MAG TPA: nitroreductase [Aquabacterium sp.]|uniref:nitroreductase n=1 Tax=Aquabacterium sp. TaxID=1872578 RepID=UPI002E378223|nr:nitroreductase [Aquabacterium sp.]HEX5373493.1 nitroreductase [Aquabacterium sp.]